uniref:Uncharacterized protein n=1 Tax=Myotis myotis TaxID=51298 RepID=A0A7J7VYD6_MYOMY|nr:hypothetical protein mMyoMyo1_012238 [Myotis myotis]
MALRHCCGSGTRCLSLLQVVPWGSASSTGPSQGNLPWPAMPNTAFNMIPLSFRLGRVPRHGQCALVLCPPPRAGPVLLCPNSKAKLGGIHPPPCPAMVLKLQDNVNLVSLAQQGCCCSSEPPVMPAEAASLSKGLRTWSWPHKMVGSTSRSQARCVCLMRDTVVFAFTQAGLWRPQTGIHLNGLVFV